MTDPLSILAERRGAVTHVANRLGISAPAVSMWQHRGIPAKRLDAVCAALAELDHGGPVAQRDAAPSQAVA